MDHRDRTGLVAACVALVLAALAWMVDLDGHDGAEFAAIDRATGHALESTAVGQPYTWYLRQTGSRATIIAASAYRDGMGRWCRPYSLAIARDAVPQSPPTRQIACRDGSGGWSRVPAAEQLAGN